MKHRLILILIFVIMVTSLYSNSNDSIKLDIIKYLIEVGELNETEDIREYYDNIYIREVIKNKDLTTDIGVYRCGTFSSHSKSFLLLKGDTTYVIQDLKNLDIALLKVINFLKSNNFDSKEIIKYVEKAIVLYQRNLKAIPWTEED